MVDTPDQASPTTPPKPAPRWRRASRVAATAVTGLLVGVGSGVLISSNSAELETAHHSLRASEQRIQELESDLSVMTVDNGELNSLLGQAQAEVASSAAKADARGRRLDAREARLDKRAEVLEQKEKALAVDTAADIAAEAIDDASVDSEFDRAYALDIATDIVEDITIIDRRLGDGIAVSSALSLLSDSYGRLLDAGMPPGTGSEYYGRLTTLQTFAADAADLYDVNPMEGAAKYAVTRQQTGLLFGQLNDALGTTFRLPPG